MLRPLLCDELYSAEADDDDDDGGYVDLPAFVFSSQMAEKK
jgi:hypothetical protein